MNGAMTQDSSQMLVNRARDGDRAAFGQLFENYRSRMAGLISSRIGPGLRGKLEVDDVLQETFTKAFQSLERFRWTGDTSFFRWLGGIANNIILKASSRKDREPKLRLEDDFAARGISPSTAMRRDERFERLQEALVDLTPEQREVVRMVRLEGLKIKDVAEGTNRTPEAVKQLMLRGLRRLRSRLGETKSLNLPDRPLDVPGGDDG